MYIRGLVLFNLMVFTNAGLWDDLMQTMSNDQSNVSQADLEEWDSYRICRNKDADSLFRICEQVDRGTTSAQCSGVKVYFGTTSEDRILLTCAASGYWKHCIALGGNDRVAIVFSLNQDEMKCYGGQKENIN